MNIQPMEIDPAEARRKLREYRSRRHKDAEREYDAAAKLFEAAGNGKRLINVAEAIRSGGFDDKFRPNLALARADRREIRLDTRARTFTFDSRHRPDGGDSPFPSLKYAFNYPKELQTDSYRWHIWYATVPMVPPHARPHKGQLRSWHILWEVDEWLDTPTINPPRDPILLEHVAGEIFAIISQWDLTPLEREAMKLALS